jgi:hypothetical protein
MPTWGDLLKEAGTTAQFEPLPSGTYDVTVTKANHKVAQSGKSMFEVQFQVNGGPHNSRSVWNRFVVSPDNPKALGYFFSNMRALGLTAEFFGANPSDDQVAAALDGRSCRVELTQTEYNGAIRNEVKKVMAPEGAAQTPVSAPSSAPAAPVMPSGNPVVPF